MCRSERVYSEAPSVWEWPLWEHGGKLQVQVWPRIHTQLHTYGVYRWVLILSTFCGSSVLSDFNFYSRLKLIRVLGLVLQIIGRVSVSLRFYRLCVRWAPPTEWVWRNQSVVVMEVAVGDQTVRSVHFLEQCSTKKCVHLVLDTPLTDRVSITSYLLHISLIYFILILLCFYIWIFVRHLN